MASQTTSMKRSHQVVEGGTYYKINSKELSFGSAHLGLTGPVPILEAASISGQPGKAERR